jgi:putative spermidine/putrescine transport system ATP-binding protein
MNALMPAPAGTNLNPEPIPSHLELRAVEKRFGHDAPVVRDLHLRLDRGEFMSLLGPSGSGKTTTLMMIAGFETLTRGEILVDGIDIAGLPPRKRNFGIVFQGYALFPQMSVLRNVEFGLKMRKVPAAAARARALDLLDKVGLADFSERRPRELSGGQQQRVALARALAIEPDVLLLDEPLGALDKTMRETLQIEIKALQRRSGVSILFITHDQEEAMMMSDRIGVMNQGRLVQLGAPEEIYVEPVNSFVANFLGETNLIACSIRGHEMGFAVIGLPGEGSGQARPPHTEIGAGSRTVVCVRPENVVLLAGSAPADNVVEARVVERVFLGRQVRLVADANGQRIVVVLPPATAAPHDLSPGAVVRLGWSALAGQILDLAATDG